MIDREAPNFLRLPKWAQQEIIRLETDVAWWKANATPEIEGSNTGVRHGYDAVQALGDSPRIEFKLGPSWFDTIEANVVRYGGKEVVRLSTGGGAPIMIFPSASNSIYVAKGSARD